MLRVCQRTALAAFAAASLGTGAILGAGARAEDLVVPLKCSISGHELRVTTATETSYKIIGRRDEQPFSACRGSSTACETMMVHRFAIDCGGQKVSWARIADAANAAGAVMPLGLPPGFAPVSSVAGRFVFPALTPANEIVARVSTQELSPDGVVRRTEDAPPAISGSWTTVVDADLLPASPGGGAYRVAGVLVMLFALLIATSMLVSGRWRFSTFRAPALPGAGHDARQIFFGFDKQLARNWQRAFAMFSAKWATFQRGNAREDLNNALAIVQVRVAEIELKTAALSPDLLLRDVLLSEIQNVRQRSIDAERDMQRWSSSQAAAKFKAMLRDLDRIARIAQSASQDSPRGVQDEAELPRSVGEAYRVLGMNADAAPAVAKKLVDALRMSWHPDHARNEDDRIRREDRMKQINAAWDMINGRREAA